MLSLCNQTLFHAITMLAVAIWVTCVLCDSWIHSHQASSFLILCARCFHKSFHHSGLFVFIQIWVPMISRFFKFEIPMDKIRENAERQLIVVFLTVWKSQRDTGIKVSGLKRCTLKWTDVPLTQVSYFSFVNTKWFDTFQTDFISLHHMCVYKIK